MPDLPATIGRYNVVSRIGRGGMATLYLAWDPTLERQVAIKILIEDNDELRERFSREARSIARLRHPSIVTMYDVGEDGGRPFMAMEYIHGETLADIIRKGVPMTTLRKLELVDALVSGLAFAHKSGIIHRDVKPPNIMVDVAGSLKILDFGIARLAESARMTRVGEPVGTFNYMSPEQLSGQPVDCRSDVFSIGAVCYELFSYRQAFPGGFNSATIQKLLSGQTEPLGTVCVGLDGAVVEIVHRCLEADLEKRYQDLESMQQDLARVRRRLTLQEGVTQVRLAPGAASVSGGGKTPRRSIDLEEFARRRASQIQAHLATAVHAFEIADYALAIAECERALMIDAEHAEAVDLLERARTADDERRVNQWLTDAEGDIERGDLTAAVSKIDQALALNPSSARAADVRRAADEAAHQRELARQRAENIRTKLSEALAGFDKGLFAEALAAVEEVLALAPDHEEAQALRSRTVDAIAARAREELERDAQECVRQARRRFDDNDHAAALELLERFEPQHELVSGALEDLRAESLRLERQRQIEREQQAKRQRIDAALIDARAEIERGQFAEAIERLRALTDAEGGSPEITALVETAEAAQLERRRAESLARDAAKAIAAAAGLYARRELAAALTRVDQALALDPDHRPAQALRTKIQDASRIAAERRDLVERRAREREQLAAAALQDARRATSDDQAIEAIYRALEMAPEHPDAQQLLDEREDRIAQAEAERQRVQQSDRARRQQVEQWLDTARRALGAEDVSGARRALRRIREIDPDNLESQCLAAEITAIHGEPMSDDAGETVGETAGETIVGHDPEIPSGWPLPSGADAQSRDTAPALSSSTSASSSTSSSWTPSSLPPLPVRFGPRYVTLGAALLILVLLLTIYVFAC